MDPASPAEKPASVALGDDHAAEDFTDDFDAPEIDASPASPMLRVPADPPIVTVYRVSSSSGLAQELDTVVHSSSFARDAWKVLLPLDEVPKARLAKCRLFLHLADAEKEEKAAQQIGRAHV